MTEQTDESLRLLGVFEAPKDKRVRCQAPGCHHTVYKRIHVVQEGHCLKVYGSQCFKKIFEGHPILRSQPSYTGSTPGRTLTDEERRMLIENTEQFIAYVEQLYKADLEDKQRKAEALKLRSSAVLPPTPQTYQSEFTRYGQFNSEEGLLKLAKENVRKYLQVDPELAGWVGLVAYEVEHLRKNGKSWAKSKAT